MLLENKNAIIYGAGGSLGSAVAKALATAGAKVFLTGHHMVPVQQAADEIITAGGNAETGEVDALDEKAVNSYVENVIARAGNIDISFCLIDYQVVQNLPLVEMNVDDFVRPVFRAMRSHFLTATAAAKAMMKQGS